MKLQFKSSKIYQCLRNETEDLTSRKVNILLVKNLKQKKNHPNQKKVSVVLLHVSNKTLLVNRHRHRYIKPLIWLHI